MIRGTARALIAACLGLPLLGCSNDTEALLDATGGAAASSGGGSASGGFPSASAGANASAGVAGVSGAGGGVTSGGVTSGVATGGASGSVAHGAGGTTPGGPSRTRQKLEPDPGKTLLFIGQDTGEVESYAGALGMPAGVMLYSNIWDGLGVLQPSDFGGYGNSDLEHWRGKSEKFALQVGLDLDHGQNCGSCAGCSRAGFLEQLANGNAERVGLVRAIVQALRDSGRPVLLRVGYEFDAERCPGGFGKYPMQAYQQAFKRVRSIVNDEHANQIALVWNAWAFQARDPVKAIGVAAWGWYPGDDVVDWIGLSVFPGSGDSDPNEKYQADKRRQFVDFAKNHGKPLMIAESTPRARFEPAKGEVAWNGWYSGVFDYIAQNDVKAFSYINMNWEALGMWSGHGWGDSRVQASPLSEQWKRALGDARFLKASDRLYNDLGL